jgi:hypothetical protein
MKRKNRDSTIFTRSLFLLTLVLFTSGCAGLLSPKRLILVPEPILGQTDSFEGCAAALASCKRSASHDYDYCTRMARLEDDRWEDQDLLTQILLRKNCNDEYFKCADSFDQCLASSNAVVSEINDGTYQSLQPRSEQRSTYSLRGRSVVKGRSIVVPVSTSGPVHLKFILPITAVNASIPVSIEATSQPSLLIEHPNNLSRVAHPISVRFADGSSCSVSIKPSWIGLEPNTLSDFVFDCF